jgi:hypothetical protein
VSTNGAAVLERLIVDERTRAIEAGEKPPGRTTLVKLAKQLVDPQVTEHQVRQAMATVDTSPSPADTSDTPDPASLATPAHQRSSLTEWWARFRRLPWALTLMGIGAGFSVWSGWVGLGGMSGYGPVRPLPGIWDSLTINSAIVLPISVEAYGAYALRVWLTPGHDRRASIYAGVSAIASLVVGGAAQVAYHELKAAGFDRAPWQVVMAVALVPVVVLALASILAKLVSSDRQGGEQA